MLIGKVAAGSCAALLIAGTAFAAGYTTKRGDTLQTVATANKMTVAQVATLNPNLVLRSGQQVKLATSTPTSTPTPTPTPTPAPTGNEKRFMAYNTLYASGDNTPKGSTRIDLGGHTGNAGGTGTYEDPITLAVGGSIINGKEIDDYAYGTKFYVPALRKYFQASDFCGDGSTPQNAACHKSEVPPYPQLDLYAGDASGSGVLNCENNLTGVRLMIQDPNPNYVVVPGPVYSNGTCAKDYGDTVVTK